MHQEWIEDILAVLEAGSLTAAAEQRFITQSAFTRRIRAIETALDVELFDRTRKPLRLMPHVMAQEQEMRSLLVRLNALRTVLKETDASTNQRVSLACQHTIATTLSPRLIRHLTRDLHVNMNIKADNRDSCLMMLMTSEVDMAIIYESTQAQPSPRPGGFLEQTLGADRMLPVVAAEFSELWELDFAVGKMRMVSYPAGIYFGALLESRFISRVSQDFQINRTAETGLASAALHYILEGIGIGWLPYSIAEPELKSGKLLDLSENLPGCDLEIKIVRLQKTLSDRAEEVWDTISKDYLTVTA
jgi:LysR family transcriptional regulator, hypochlorite-specific transcription factor HypT